MRRSAGMRFSKNQKFRLKMNNFLEIDLRPVLRGIDDRDGPGVTQRVCDESILPMEMSGSVQTMKRTRRGGREERRSWRAESWRSRSAARAAPVSGAPSRFARRATEAMMASTV